MQKLRSMIVIFLLLCFLPVLASAETNPNFFSSVLHDQKAIWSSPFKIKQNWKWIVPMTLTTAFLINRDAPWFHDYKPSRHTVDVSKNISLLGSPPVTYGIAGGVFLIGKATHNEFVSRTGALGLEALIDATIVSYGLKAVTQRERPHTGDLDGSFFAGGSSFPSGHSIGIWSITTAMLNGQHRPLWLQMAGYGLATAVSVSRVTGEKHYASDVFAGSMMGFLIGRYVSQKEEFKNRFALVPTMKRHGAGLNLVYQW